MPRGDARRQRVSGRRGARRCGGQQPSCGELPRRRGWTSRSHGEFDAAGADAHQRTDLEQLPRLQGGDRQASARHHHDDRGRGGVRLETPIRLRTRERRRVQARPGARLRHRYVGRRHPLDHDLAARACLRGGEAHLRRPRFALGAVRRRGAQSHPRARRRAFGRCTSRTARSPSPVSTTAFASCCPTSKPISRASI